MVCLDSDIIIDFMRNEKYAIDKINELKEKDIAIITTSVNTFELFRGFVTSKKYSVDLFYRFIHNVKILNFTLESSKKAAEIFEYLKVRGEILDIADIMIASIAISNNEVLLTRNVKHFQRIPELKIEKI
ncbi:type II toxin-antitoxin system VapC family toxin [Candidatus Pacearchaeota archaeon]|nr:type II toxin-antitoxin system VapC family toxin [Candidatus Pacearchaeota archaeon]